MINLTTYKIQKTIDFISIEGVPEVKLYIIPNAKSIETPEGNTALSYYGKETSTIFVAEDINTELDSFILFTEIASRYYHHIEHCFKVDHDEMEARAFVEKLLDLWVDYAQFKIKYSKMFKHKKEKMQSENY